MSEYLDDIRPDRGMPYNNPSGAIPGYRDALGNVIGVGDYVLTATSQSGRLTFGRITRVTGPSATQLDIDSHNIYPRVYWQSWGYRYDYRTNERVYRWGPEREIRSYATTRYTGRLPVGLIERA